jgi:hypothetical protein
VRLFAPTGTRCNWISASLFLRDRIHSYEQLELLLPPLCRESWRDRAQCSYTLVGSDRSGYRGQESERDELDVFVQHTVKREFAA